MATRSFRIKRNPVRFGGGWNLQLMEAGQIILTKNEPENQCPHGFEFAGQIHNDLALLACKLDGQSWIEEGVRP